MAFCIDCGQQIEAGANFCNACGKKVSGTTDSTVAAAVAATAPATVPPAREVKPPRAEGRSKNVLIVSAVLGLIGLAVMFAIFIDSFSPKVSVGGQQHFEERARWRASVKGSPQRMSDTLAKFDRTAARPDLQAYRSSLTNARKLCVAIYHEAHPLVQKAAEKNELSDAEFLEADNYFWIEGNAIETLAQLQDVFDIKTQASPEHFARTGYLRDSVADWIKKTDIQIEKVQRTLDTYAADPHAIQLYGEQPTTLQSRLNH